MGIWNVLGRMVQGKPVFEDPTTAASSESQESSGLSDKSRTPVDVSGHKIIPSIAFLHCKSFHRGDQLEVEAWVTNQSDQEVELDTLQLLSAKVELDRRLRPSESRQIWIYKGPIPTNEHDNRAHVYFKTVASNDYFVADFLVEFTRQRDGAFFVEEFHPEPYARDI